MGSGLNHLLEAVFELVAEVGQVLGDLGLSVEDEEALIL